MEKTKDLPGTLQHQRILHAITTYYETDPRILAITVFGSLGRGDWDCYSDIDLDVVVTDEAKIDVEAELIQLGAFLTQIDEQIALLITDRDDADVVFKSLMEFSIRYHPLAGTSPNIVDSMLLLTGRIDLSTIKSAGLTNHEPNDEPLSRILDRCIRYALEVDSALYRGYLWSAIELLHYMRHKLMELFTCSHQGTRSYQFFQKEADQKLQVQLGGTLPLYDLKSVQECLSKFMDILTKDLDQFTDGQAKLTMEHLGLITAIHSRQDNLRL